jgi:hypothetical protein
VEVSSAAAAISSPSTSRTRGGYFQHRLPGGIEMHDLAADGRVLENEALQAVVNGHFM